jgi:ketosteroid isomerase-like protein
VEIRSYNLKPGTRERFHQRFVRDSLPMLQRRGIDVVAYGASAHDRDSYFLMRSYPSLDDRIRSENEFYGSAEWREGPREAVLADIDTYATVVVDLDPSTIRGLREIRPSGAAEGVGRGGSMDSNAAVASDRDALLALNADYIRAVQTSDVDRFKQILADDFLCTQSDGSLLNRDAFLKHTANPSGLSNLEAHDVNVRLMGDVAIVHARTTFVTSGGARSGRYTDVWARRGGRWVAVSAHVTRLP